MSQDKHTPGPWRAVKDHARQTSWNVEREAFADCEESHRPVTFGARENDARLIAAAPELLAALETLIIAPTSQAAWNNARAAIARARGDK